MIRSVLSGTFDFTAPFAAAAWALGNDNTAATADDFLVFVPANLNNITFTASSLGSATIQGPGDLATVNLEAFLVFDGGDNQGWTISNLRILDFDLSIGMFNGAGGPDAFNGTIIQNNFIRMAQDLNAIVASADVNQNIGIHYSFGTNQTDREQHPPEPWRRGQRRHELRGGGGDAEQYQRRRGLRRPFDQRQHHRSVERAVRDSADAPRHLGERAWPTRATSPSAATPS